MGYTHYWRKCLELDVETFKLFAEDCLEIIKLAKKEGLSNIANWEGEGEPEITNDLISFNGDHSLNDGCETFSFTRVDDMEYADDHGLIFDCTKTGEYPYDCVVTACLIASKYHFKDNIYISSDGEPEDWIKGLFLASAIIGGDLKETFVHLFDKPSDELRKAFTKKLHEIEKEGMKDKPIPGSISSKDTAKLIRQDLKKAYPKCKFSVKSDWDSIRVKWINGPSSSKVKELVGHYKSGNYVKITKSYGYDDSPYYNRYLFFDREYEHETYVIKAREISKEWGVIIPDDTTYDNLYSVLWSKGKEIKTDLEREVYKEISQMDL